VKILLNTFLALSLAAACAPYSKGPVLSMQETEETFRPLISFMEIEPGMHIADVGAGSGAYTVMMATQIEDCIFYIQDIDPRILRKGKVEKIKEHYSEQLGHELRSELKIIYGSPTRSNLPDGSVDVIYMNAVAHVLDYPDEMIYDLSKKLTPSGKIYIRDGFKNHNGEGEFCTFSKCAKPLLDIPELHELMARNGFTLYKKSDDIDGYPVFGYELN
jgi:ubiquinone/menaquinone biosynthesis C-methylase UbiE